MTDATHGDLTDPAAALRLAAAAHDGQTDQAGEPYAAHPERVQRYAVAAARRAGFAAGRVRHVGVAAALHDVAEDTPVTVDALVADGLEAPVAAALACLTRADGEAYADAVARACADPVAAAVKAGDLADNLDPRRLAALDDHVAARLRAKYADPWSAVTAALGLDGLDSAALRDDAAPARSTRPTPSIEG